MMTLLAGALAGAVTFFGSLFGGHMPPQQNGSTTPSENHGTTTPWHNGEMGMGSTTPAIMGKVISIDGTSLTVIGRGPGSTASTTYSIDATSAKIYKREIGSTTPATVSDIKTGDSVVVAGTVSGTSVAAKLIFDGVMMPRISNEPGGMHMGTSSMMRMGTSSEMRMKGMEMQGQKPAQPQQ